MLNVSIFFLFASLLWSVCVLALREEEIRREKECLESAPKMFSSILRIFVTLVAIRLLYQSSCSHRTVFKSRVKQQKLLSTEGQ